jgi:hypothetical protein
MNTFDLKKFDLKKRGLLGGVFGGLILGAPALFSTALATPNPRVNPCPTIYYEEPYNSRLIVPQSCPPNAITRFVNQNPGAIQRGIGIPESNVNQPIQPSAGQRPSVFNEAPYNRATVPGTAITRPIQPPLPEQRSQPIARVIPTNSSINVRLKNDTNVTLTYEAVQYTQRRSLRPGEEVLLQNIPVPATFTFVRQDNGFVEVIPVSTSEQGLLSLTLDEDATPLDRNQGVIRVQQNGQVFLN